MKAYIEQLTRERDFLVKNFNKYKANIEKGRDKIAVVNKKIKIMTKKKDKLQKEYDEQLNIFKEKEMSLKNLKAEYDEMQTKRKMNSPNESLFSLQRGGNYIYEWKEPPQDIQNFIYSQNGKTFKEVLALVNKTMYLMEIKDLVRFTQAEMTFEEKQDKTILNHQKVMKFRDKFTVQIIYQTRKYQFIFLEPKDEDPLWNKEEGGKKQYRNTSFKRVRYYACSYFNLQGRFYSLVDQYGRIYQNQDDLYLQNLFVIQVIKLQHKKEQLEIYGYFRKNDIKTEKPMENFLYVELKLKVEINFYLNKQRYYRERVGVFKKILHKVIYRKPDTLKMYYLDQVNGPKFITQDPKTKIVDNNKFLIDENDAIFDIEEQLDQQIFNDIEIKQNMNKIQMKYERRAANEDHGQTVNKLQKEIKDFEKIRIQGHQRNMCLFLIFYVLLNLSVAWSKNQKDIQRNRLLVDHKILEVPIYSNSYTRYTFYDIQNTQLLQDWIIRVFEDILLTKWYNGEDMTENEQKTVYYSNYLIGSIRILQKRINAMACGGHGHGDDTKYGYFKGINNQEDACYSDLVDNPSHQTTTSVIKMRYPNYLKTVVESTYQSKNIGSENYEFYDETYILEISGSGLSDADKQFIVDKLIVCGQYNSNQQKTRTLLDSLDQGGYQLLVDRSDKIANIKQIIYILFHQNWIQVNTRMIFFDMNLYNPVSDTLLSIEIFFKYQMQGNIQIGKNIRQNRIFCYWRSSDLYHIVLQIVCLVWSYMYLFLKFRNSVGNNFKQKLINTFNDLALFHSFMTLVLTIKYILISVAYLDSISINLNYGKENEFVDLMSLLEFDRWITFFESFTCSVWIFQLLYYFRQSQILKVITKAVQQSIVYIFYIYLMIGICVYTCAYMLTIIYGSELYVYRNINTSIYAVIGQVLSNFQYDKHVRVDRLVTNLYFIFYVIFFKLVFISIINSNFLCNYFKIANIHRKENIQAEQQQNYKRQDDIIMILKYCLYDFMDIVLFPFKLVTCYYQFRYFKNKIRYKLIQSRDQKLKMQLLEEKETQQKKIIQQKTIQIQKQKKEKEKYTVHKQNEINKVMDDYEDKSLQDSQQIQTNKKNQSENVSQSDEYNQEKSVHNENVTSEITNLQTKQQIDIDQIGQDLENELDQFLDIDDDLDLDDDQNAESGDEDEDDDDISQN